MTAASEPTVPSAAAGTDTAPEQTIAPLATAASDMVQAWANLLGQEFALAQRSLRRSLIGIVAVPVVALSLWLSLSALLIAAAYAYSGNWFIALLLGTSAQALALGLLLRQLRHWARDLSLPQSRAALIRAMERMT